MSTKVLLVRGEAMSLGAQDETLCLVSGHWSISRTGTLLLGLRASVYLLFLTLR